MTEREIQQHFFDNLDDYLPGATIAEAPNVSQCDRRGIPDGWVIYKGNLCPVEVKQRNFGAWALQQLTAYLRNYQCKIGIAVSDHFAMTARSSERIVCVTVPVDRSQEKQPV